VGQASCKGGGKGNTVSFRGVAKKKAGTILTCSTGFSRKEARVEVEKLKVLLLMCKKEGESCFPDGAESEGHRHAHYNIGGEIRVIAKGKRTSILAKATPGKDCAHLLAWRKEKIGGNWLPLKETIRRKRGVLLLLCVYEREGGKAWPRAFFQEEAEKKGKRIVVSACST